MKKSTLAISRFVLCSFSKIFTIFPTSSRTVKRHRERESEKKNNTSGFCFSPVWSVIYYSRCALCTNWTITIIIHTWWFLCHVYCTKTTKQMKKMKKILTLIISVCVCVCVYMYARLVLVRHYFILYFQTLLFK